MSFLNQWSAFFRKSRLSQDLFYSLWEFTLIYDIWTDWDYAWLIKPRGTAAPSLQNGTEIRGKPYVGLSHKVSKIIPPIYMYMCIYLYVYIYIFLINVFIILTSGSWLLLSNIRSIKKTLCHNKICRIGMEVLLLTGVSSAGQYSDESWDIVMRVPLCFMCLSAAWEREREREEGISFSLREK